MLCQSFMELICIVLVLYIFEILLFANGETIAAVQPVFTSEEITALEELKFRISGKIPDTSIIKNYENDDLFLVRWLRMTTPLNVPDAERLFFNHLHWREEQRLDEIHREKFSKIMVDFPAFYDINGKQGEPVLEIWFSNWKIKHFVDAGRITELLRWIINVFEMTSRRLYDERAKGNETIMGAIMLMGLRNFSLEEQACQQCFPVLMRIIIILENHYPGLFEHIYLLDKPDSFDVVLKFIRPALSTRTRLTLASYHSETEWKSAIQNLIDVTKIKRPPRPQKAKTIGQSSDKNNFKVQTRKVQANQPPRNKAQANQPSANKAQTNKVH